MEIVIFEMNAIFNSNNLLMVFVGYAFGFVVIVDLLKYDCHLYMSMLFRYLDMQPN